MERIGFGNEALLMGRRLKMEDGVWTVIFSSPFDTYLVEQRHEATQKQESTRLVRKRLDTSMLFNDINNGIVEILPAEDRIIPQMSPGADARLERDYDLVNAVKEVYGPTYEGLFNHEPKVALQDIFRTYKVSVTTGWDKIGKYLRGGLKKSALVDPRYYKECPNVNRKKINGRRPLDSHEGKPLTEYDLNAFAFGMRILLGSGKQGYTSSYRTMAGMFYCDVVDGKLTVTEMPSQRRFEYYCKCRMTEEQRLKAQKNEREFTNDCRYIFDTNITNTLRIGTDIEIDAFEPGIQLVSAQDPTRLVGKATVYTAMDIRTRMILAVSVGFEENSYIGISNLMRNLLVDDNYNRLMLLGFKDVDRDLVPGNIHPERAYLDRGPEMKAEDTIAMFKNLHIALSSEPPATGSMKGMVERSYRTFMDTVRPELENYGLTTGKYGDNGRKTAALTIEGFEKLMMRYILYHNSTPNSKFILTPEMLAAKPKVVSPVWLWRFGVSQPGIAPDRVPSEDKRRIVFELMKEVVATLTREGIVFKHLVYDARVNDRLKDLCIASKRNANKRHPDGTRFNDLKCAIDPRDIGSIYVRDGSNVIEIPINTGRCGFGPGMSWAIFETRFLPEINRLIRESKTERDVAAIMMKSYIAYLAETNRRYTYADVKNETENLAKEKAFLNYQGKLGNTLRELDGDNPDPADEVTLVLTKPDENPDCDEDDGADNGSEESDPEAGTGESMKSKFYDLF